MAVNGHHGSKSMSTDVERLRQAIKAQFEEAKETYRKKMEAIDLLFGCSDANGSAAASKRTKKTDEPLRPLSEKGALKAAVRLALTGLRVDPFDMFMVLTNVENLGYAPEDIKKPSVNSVLASLVESGELEIVTPGIGRRATRYRLTPAFKT
jgi:hypothetical protein